MRAIARVGTKNLASSKRKEYRTISNAKSQSLLRDTLEGKLNLHMFKISEIQDKNVLIRADLDLPIVDGRAENNFRLKKLLPTLLECLKYAQKTCLIGHLGRPKDPSDPAFSLAPIRDELKRLINQDITMFNMGFSPGEWWKGESSIVLIDNLRGDSREENISSDFAKYLSTGADIYIYESFATYRPCTSLSLIPEVLPTRTGIQFDEEVKTLNNLLNEPGRPTLLIGSGAKKDKLEILNSLKGKFDLSYFGGVFAPSSDLTPDGLDLNDEGVSKVLSLISEAKTIVMNGPLGKFEDGIHDKATSVVLAALTDPQKYSILGGGDTLSAIPHLGFDYTQYGFVSTGGGALLEYLATGSHPLLAVLK